MDYEFLWDAFAGTGDPMYYLMYRELSDAATPDSAEKPACRSVTPV